MKGTLARVMCAICAGLMSPVLCPAAPLPGGAAASRPLGVRVLAVSDRTSLVIDLDEPPSQVKSDRVDASNLIVEVGPVSRPTQPRDLKPEAGMPLLSGVSVRQSSADQRRIRVRLTFTAGCQATVRSAGKRLYVDLTATPTPTPTPKLTPTPTLTTTPKPTPTPTLTPTPPRNPPAARATASRDAVDLRSLGYLELAAPVSEAAAALAKRPDITGLLALRSRVVNRDEELGHRAPELIERVLADIDQRLDEARRLRLKLDAIEFERAGRGARK